MSLPRLLAGVRDRTLSLADHEATHGPASARADAELGDLVSAAGLRGRGGAAFPSALKLRGVAGRRGPRCVLVNGAEGEPMSAKDGVLMRLVPHLVLDGALAAADAIGAREIIVAIRAGSTDARAAMLHAVGERSLGARVTVVSVPVAYLAGEETALIRFLDGGPLKPDGATWRPFERGLHGRPTLVQNPETLAHLALIDRYGPSWFRELGTEAQPGSTLVTMAGAIRHPGVLEIGGGSPLQQLLEAAGGASEPLRAVLVGGYHGIWIAASDVPTVTLDDASLAAHGGSLGAGVIVALAQTACPVSELVSTMQWLADQSAHQCGPCSNGLPALAGLLDEMAAGHSDSTGWDRLSRWSADLPGRGACHLPDGAVRFLTSGMRVFAREIAEHEHRGRCSACRRPTTLAAPATLARLAA